MNVPRKYRKRPVVIGAIQWTGTNYEAVSAFAEADPPPDAKRVPVSVTGMTVHRRVKPCAAPANGPRDSLYVMTKEGGTYAVIGDWILKGVAGEIYPCANDIFRATYDEVPDGEA